MYKKMETLAGGNKIEKKIWLFLFEVPTIVTGEDKKEKKQVWAEIMVRQDLISWTRTIDNGQW